MKNKPDTSERQSFKASVKSPAKTSDRPRPGPDPAPRAEEEATLLPGLKPVLELVRDAPERVDTVFLRKGRHGREMDEIIDLCRASRVRFSLLDSAAFARLYKGGSQGVLARLFAAGFVEVDDLLASAPHAPLPLVLVLDQVQDPGNAGALARTLYAMGGAGLIIPRHNGVYLGAAAAKASAGALERLPVAKAANIGQALDAAVKQGFTVYGADAGPRDADGHDGLPVAAKDGAPSMTKGDSPATAKGGATDGVRAQWSGHPGKGGKSARADKEPQYLDAFADPGPRAPALLVLGGEEAGLRPGVRARCEYLLRIPMLRDFDSLNVAQAGGILISCFLRQARAAGR